LFKALALELTQVYANTCGSLASLIPKRRGKSRENRTRGDAPVALGGGRGEQKSLSRTAVFAPGPAPRVEHYEIAGYGTVRTYAELFGDKEGAKLLETTLREEEETDKELTKVAKSAINLAAAK
jgi:Domain of unknown function (DUF892)